MMHMTIETTIAIACSICGLLSLPTETELVRFACDCGETNDLDMTWAFSEPEPLDGFDIELAKMSSDELDELATAAASRQGGL